jgi:hypothetical protein
MKNPARKQAEISVVLGMLRLLTRAVLCVGAISLNKFNLFFTLR